MVIKNTLSHLDYGTPAIILPCGPIALVERLDILMACKAAGNTGVRNELVSVRDELLRQHLIDKCKYNIIMLQLYNSNNKKNLQEEKRYWSCWYLRIHRELFCENVFE